jgi:hypothetical protein
MRTRLLCIAMTAAACLIFTGAAQAHLLKTTLTLAGSNEVPAVVTPATGTAVLAIDTDANTISYTITYSGMADGAGGNPTAAHFHGYVPVGQNAGVVQPITVGASPITGVWNYPEGSEANILNGLSYINLHSAPHPNGEIRAWVNHLEPVFIDTPALSTRGIALLSLVLLGAAAVVIRQRQLKA